MSARTLAKWLTDVTGTRTFTYNDQFQLAAETNVLGQITRTYDSLGRSTGFSVGSGYSVAYGFNGVGKFSSLTPQVAGVSLQPFTYAYLAGSDLLSGWSNDVLQVSRQFEVNRNLLTQVKNSSGATSISQFDYANDALGRRPQRVDTLAVTNVFSYNLRSELVAASMGTNSYNYWYDSIGNRLSASNNAEAISYAANSLNQYTNISGNAVVTPLYDLDGNITNHGAYAYSWDAENRLTSVASNGSVIASFAYDYMSRRVSKVVNGVTNSFMYDGWNLIQEATSSGATNSYVWGLDLSGSLQGAGGIGGLLLGNFNGTTAYYSFDANGNVTDLVGVNGSVVGHYEFDPYGSLMVKSGSMAGGNPFRFSTKYTDDEPALIYYGYRYYHPETGRWLSRDPIEELGAKNLYGMVGNNPVTAFDALGLLSSVCKCCCAEDVTISPSSPNSQIGLWKDTYYRCQDSLEMSPFSTH